MISGGRPELKARPTHKFLDSLHDAGFGGPLWVVSERDADSYETDQHELVTYPNDWAYPYAKTHWMLPTPPERNGFLGAFPGREWACLEAERRGCWGVLQLDDNFIALYFLRRIATGTEVIRRIGGLPKFADLLGACTLATNGRMVGANLSSVPQVSHSDQKIICAGFPYSIFVEQVGTGRENWFGPFEDDITHAYQYGTRADGVTAARMPLLRYMKESTSNSGMRTQYGHTRAVQLQRIFPESAKIGIRMAKSNGRGGPRIYHTMLAGAIRNRVAVQDQYLYGQVRDEITAAIQLYAELFPSAVREKICKRVAALS